MAGASSGKKKPVRVAVTGAAGAIAYSLLFRIAAGEMLGHDQPIILQCIDLPDAMTKLNGTIMELADCAFPLVHDIEAHSDLNKGFKDTDFALLVGARPRGPGMERADLMKVNAEIFSVQGKAIDGNASRGVKVLVVGNPANTNSLIAKENAPSLKPEQFTAMTRLDHNRGLAMLASKLGTTVTSFEKFAIWGNHSPSMYPDITHATVNGKSVKEALNDEKWVVEKFIPDVGQRGAAIIKARGASSAASAASAAIDHMHDWHLGTNGKWVSMAVPSDGSYGVEPGVIFSYPVTCEGGKYKIVQGLTVDQFSKDRIAITKKELFDERAMVAHLLKK